MVWKTSCLLLLVVLFLTSLFLFIIYLLSCILSLFPSFYLYDFFVPFCIMRLYLYRFFLPIKKKKKKNAVPNGQARVMQLDKAFKPIDLGLL